MKKLFTIAVVLIYAAHCFAGTSVGNIYEVIGASLSDETFGSFSPHPIYIYDGVSESITFKAIVSRKNYEGKGWRLYFRTRKNQNDNFPYPVGDITVTQIGENSYRLVASMPASLLYNNVVNNDVCFCAGTYGTSHNYNTPPVYIKKVPLYTITTSATNGTVTGGGAYINNATPTLTATPDECYRFVQWSDGNTDNPRTITVTGNATYTAEFEQIQYTIEAQSADAGQGSATVTNP